MAEVEAARPFHLGRDLMMRATLLALKENHYALLLTMHHIASDGWSIEVLVRETAALYRALISGEPPTLPPLPIQYVDYAAWQRNDLNEAAFQQQLSYWKLQLEGAPPFLDLSADFPRPPVQTYDGALIAFDLGANLRSDLETLARNNGATLFMVLNAAFAVLLSRHSGQKDFCVGTPVANRNRSELEGLIGYFVNTLVFRYHFHEDPSFLDFG